MIEREVYEKLSLLLRKEGYVRIEINPLLKSLSWSFDILAEKKSETKLIEVRIGRDVPDILLQRISQITKYPKKLKIFLAFDSAPRNSTLTLLKNKGIGAMFFQKNKVYYLLKSKDFSEKPKKVKKPSKKEDKKKFNPMHQIWVYPATIQYELDRKTINKERKIICNLVKKYKKKLIPIDVHLVEDDRKDDNKFKKKIIRNLKESHIFIGAIETRYSKYVKFEMENVFGIIKDKLLILIMKQDMSLDEIEENELVLKKRIYKRKKLLELISFVEGKISHTHYASYKEFEEKVDNELIKMIDRLFKKNKSKPPFSF